MNVNFNVNNVNVNLNNYIQSKQEQISEIGFEEMFKQANPSAESMAISFDHSADDVATNEPLTQSVVAVSRIEKMNDVTEERNEQRFNSIEMEEEIDVEDISDFPQVDPVSKVNSDLLEATLVANNFRNIISESNFSSNINEENIIKQENIFNNNQELLNKLNQDQNNFYYRHGGLLA